MALLDSLNDKQRQAAECIKGPVMIIAGAGSGKTRTLMYRIANILEQGENPFSIMALTFTNKAAGEMKTRIAELVGPKAHSLWMGTFHSVFCRVLRANAEKLGYEKTFSIYDTEDSRNLIKNIVKERSLDPKQYNPKYISSRISMAKSALISPSGYIGNKTIIEEDRISQRPLIGEIYQEYQNRLFKAGAMDFDDLLFQTNVLLRDHPQVLLKYQENFKYIMVDEYQDTNYAQYLIVKKLSAKYKNICVVGDDSQSIYSFRGANIQNILNFKADYPQAATVALEQNYRSTETIVNLSNVLIQNNQGRIPKTIWTSNDAGSLVKLIDAPSEEEEGRMVAQQIFETEMNDRVHHKEFAILYRTNNQSKAMEDALRKLNIPYRIYGGKSFYQRKEIKDMVAYFRWVVNPKDEACMLRCINLPARGIGDTTIDRLRIFAESQSVSIFEAIDLLRRPENQAESNIGSAYVVKLARVYDMIKSLHIRLESTDAYTLASDIWKHSGIEQEYKNEGTIESGSRIMNVEELLNSVQEYIEKEHFDIDEETGEMLPLEGIVTLDRFLQEIALLTDMDEESKDGEKDSKEVVTLMTIHSSKGLEYPYVFVVGCEEDLFPSQMSSSTQEELEEERRLFYVAVTRSEKKLFLSFARRRMRWGQRNDTKPSRFLSEIKESGCFENPKVLETRTAVPFVSWEDDDREYNIYSKAGLSIGQKTTIVNSPAPKNLRRISVPSVAGIRANSGVDPLNTDPRIQASNTLSGKASSSEFSIGARVSHSKFGTGSIVDIQGQGSDQRIVVKFDSLNQPKTLLSAFAKLKLI